MSSLKIYNEKNVYDSANERIEYTFDNFDKIYVSFSGGKDSTVMLHIAIDEAKKRNKKIGVLVIDLEAQYKSTIKHIEDMVTKYSDYIDLYWVCLPLLLRNAVSNFEPRWICWEPGRENDWVRELPKNINVINDPYYFDFYIHNMEFEEFMVLFGKWYSGGQSTAGMVGIRADESLNRFRSISSKTKEMHNNKRYTTKITDDLYNLYPIYDWKTSDIWKYHVKHPEKEYNKVYDLMHKAGLKPSQMRLCQPYGDDQRRGIWLYHILEPDIWFKVVSRVNGVNSGSIYIQENGNINGYNKISKPSNHTWKSFVNLLLSTLPDKTRDHYIEKFINYLKSWKRKGYHNEIQDEAPLVLENKNLVPSWRKICKTILRNDYWCKSLGMSQPRSEAYGKYLKMKGKITKTYNELKEERRWKKMKKGKLDDKILKMIYSENKNKPKTNKKIELF